MKIIPIALFILCSVLFVGCNADRQSAPPAESVPIEASQTESSLSASAEDSVSKSEEEETAQSPAANEATDLSQPIATDNEPIEIEAEYFPTGEQQHIIMNPRFRFALTMPDTWKAFDRSANGDGYFIDCGNPAVDIRVYGRYNVVPKEEDESGETFALANGQTGWIEQIPGESIHYSYLADERIITFYVNYQQDAQWYAEQSENLAAIATTLRDTQ